jgi:dihydrofolate reductase
MKTILYMASTINGYIATRDNETPWSDEEWQAYEKLVKGKGNMVIGRRTFELMDEEDSLDKLGVDVVVVSSSSLKPKSKVFVVNSPVDAIKYLSEKGHKNILLGGGGSLNASFMKENLVDEVILDIEPQIFGDGIKLFSEFEGSVKLELENIKNLSKNLLRLHYKVIK